MRNIARFLFRILLFSPLAEKRRLPGARFGRRYTRLTLKIHLALILKWVWGDICGYELTIYEICAIMYQSKSKPFLQNRKKMIDKSLVKLL